MITEIANMRKYQSNEYLLGDQFIAMYVVKMESCYIVSIMDHVGHVKILAEKFIETAQEVYDLYVKAYKKYVGL